MPLHLKFLYAINLLRSSRNGNRAVLGAAWGSGVVRGWSAQQRSCLAEERCASSTGALKQAASSLHGPPEDVLLLQIDLQMG